MSSVEARLDALGESMCDVVQRLDAHSTLYREAREGSEVVSAATVIPEAVRRTANAAVSDLLDAAELVHRATEAYQALYYTLIVLSDDRMATGPFDEFCEASGYDDIGKCFSIIEQWTADAVGGVGDRWDVHPWELRAMFPQASPVPVAASGL